MTTRRALAGTLASLVALAGCGGSETESAGPPPEPGLVDVTDGPWRTQAEDLCGDRIEIGLELVDPATGDTVWAQRTDWAVSGLPDPARGAFLVAHPAADRASVVSYDLATGDAKWQRVFAADQVSNVDVAGSVLVVDRKGGTRGLIGLDPSTGELRWQTPVPSDHRMGRFEVVDNTVRNPTWAAALPDGSTLGDRSTPDPRVVSVDGRQELRIGDRRSDPLPGDHATTVQVDGAIAVVAVGHPASVVGVDLRTATLAWELPGATTVTPASTLLARHTAERTLSAVDPLTGDERWRLDDVDRVRPGETVAFIVSGTDRLRTIDLGTGEVLESTVRDHVDGERLIVAGDTLVSKRWGADGGTTLAPIDVATGSEMWSTAFDTETTVWRVTPAGWVLKSDDRLDCDPGPGFDD